MLPVSAKDIVRFPLTPGSGVRADLTLLLGVPGYLQRAAFRRDLRAAGANYPGEQALFQAVRDDLAELDPVNRDDLMGCIEEVEAQFQARMEILRAGRTDEDMPRLADDLVKKLETITSMVRALGGRYARVEGERQFFQDIWPFIALRHFLMGWEGAGASKLPPFRREHNQVPDAVLAGLSEAEIKAAGWHMAALMYPSADAVGNSKSSSPDTSGRRPFETEPTTSPATTDGKSADGSTGQTLLAG